ncbi:MAG TPA: hypothetical protein QF800_04380 [Phycisphaerales bacterium]|nr:hypothetical protein [Phycisphaerales bacterium]
MPATALLMFLMTFLSSPQSLLRSDELGLDIVLPPAARIMQRPGNGGEHFLIRDGAAEPSWSLRLESTPVKQVTSSDILDDLSGISPTDQVLRRQAHAVDGRQAESLWLLREGPNGRSVVLGWLAIPQVLGRAAVCSAVTTPEALDATQLIMDTAFASIRLRDRQATMLATKAASRKGEQLLQAIDEKALRSLNGHRQVLRIHRTGEKEGELAYGTLEATIGPKGAISGVAGTPDQWQATDQEVGLIVTTHLRFALNPQNDHYVDRAERSWVSFDLKREMWADYATERQGDRRWTTTELGFRQAPTLGQPRGSLMVVRSDQRNDTRDNWNYEIGQDWLPRGLRWLLPAIAPIGTELVAWRTWDTSSLVPRVTIRRDQVVDGKHFSWSGLDGLPTVLSYNSEGHLLRAARPDDTLIDTVDDETVALIWQNAGLKLR